MTSLSLQTGSLYASGLDSTFTGTGGPQGFDPFTAQFSGVVSSGGLAGQPFADTVYGVAAGDEVTFVIAVQNTDAAPAWNVAVRATMPVGFVPPPEGEDISVTDGTGAVLRATGDLFGAAGLMIGSALAGYDADSGRNLELITYTLSAGAGVPAPEATLAAGATVTNVAASSGGADIPAAHPAAATTTIVTAAPTPTVVAETDPSAIAVGQTVTFDATIAVPAGAAEDLRLDSILPADLTLVSTAVSAVGSGLQAGTPTIDPSGTIHFGTVTSMGDTGTAGTNAITARITVRAAGSTSGPATLQTVVSAADTNGDGGRWSQDVASAIGIVAPAAAPSPFSGIWTEQHATTTATLLPFGGLTLTDAASGTATLAITLQDGSLGHMSGTGIGSFDSAGDTYVATGSLADLQAAARQIAFSPTQVGTEGFDITLVDSAGVISQNGASSVAISASVDTMGLAQHFAPAPGTQFLTATADGQQTLFEGEVYQGPVSTLQDQYIYDGQLPVAIVAETPNVFVKNFVGDAAVQLLSGQNVVDAGKGSNYLIGGSGNDVFFLDGRTNAVTWDTIINFHAGDIATVFGYVAGVSTYHWDDLAGAVNAQGRTLRLDLPGTGGISGSITFANTTQAQTDHYALTTGQISGIPYMTIFSQ